jgi:hypothetical protein
LDYYAYQITATIESHNKLNPAFSNFFLNYDGKVIVFIVVVDATRVGDHAHYFILRFSISSAQILAAEKYISPTQQDGTWSFHFPVFQGYLGVSSCRAISRSASHWVYSQANGNR